VRFANIVEKKRNRIVERIVLDTNILISGILFGGKPRQILESVIQGKINAYLSYDIFTEFRDVLARPKFGLSREVCLVIYREVEDTFSFVSPEIKVDLIKEDPDDNVILECALSAGANYIISGDPHLLNLKSFEGIPILSPSKYLSNYKKRTGKNR